MKSISKEKWIELIKFFIKSDANNKLYNDLLSGFVKLKESYDEVYFCYYIDVEYNEEYLDFRMKNERN